MEFQLGARKNKKTVSKSTKSPKSDIDNQSTMSYEGSLYDNQYNQYDDNQSNFSNYGTPSQIYQECITEDELIVPSNDIKLQESNNNEEQETFTLNDPSTSEQSRYNLRSMSKLLTGF